MEHGSRREQSQAAHERRPDAAPNWPRSRYSWWPEVLKAVQAPRPTDPIDAMVHDTRLLVEWVRHAPGLWERIVQEYENPPPDRFMGQTLVDELNAIGRFYFAAAGREVAVPASLVASNVLSWLSGHWSDLYGEDAERSFRAQAAKTLRRAHEELGTCGAN